MGKVSRDFVSDSLKKVIFFTILVLGATASQQQQGCCIGGGGGGDDSGGAGGEGASGEGGDKNCLDNSLADPMSPMVNFKVDVVQNIFQKNCSLNDGCHAAQQMGSTAQPYLGPISGTVVDAQKNQVYAEIAGVAAVKEPDMMIVDPGHPETSFIMYKIDHDLACSRLKCGAACGDPMPQKATQLEKTDRDTVRRWIAQGALNN